MQRRLLVFALAIVMSYATSVEAGMAIKRPNIISRAQWRADESLLVQSKNGAVTPGIADLGEVGDATERARECNEWQRLYPEDFKTEHTVTHNDKGQELRWTQRHSPRIKLLVIHHTAMKVTGDDRSSAERMRALYQYHADGQGWGDIGYHYVIDEKGGIYEGRSGGDKVVGGHVYCANVGTIGIALMGNFEVERPTQAQLRNLKWLLAFLAQEYKINLKGRVRFRGEMIPTIVGHGVIGRTRCPGYYLREVMGQLRTHIIAGRLGSPITPPSLRFYQDGTQERRDMRLARMAKKEPALTPIGSTEIIGRPGGHVTFQIEYRAGSASVPRRARLAEVERSHPRIGIWQELAGRDVRVRRELLSPSFLRPEETQIINLRVQLPRQAQGYELRIGDILYTLRAEGRRIRGPQGNPVPQSYNPEADQNMPLRTRKPTAALETSSKAQSHSKIIRIRLGYENKNATVSTNTLPSINGKYLGSRTIELMQDGNACTALVGGLRLSSEIIRIDPGSGINTISSWKKSANRFRGIIECRIVDGELALINELPLEQYLAGLAEEPDSEPYEKQRAFAIAARSYSSYYLELLHRKFPGKPYDGDDSPARFQMYGGIYFEENNPRWLEAVESTEGQVIMKDGQVVKTPYFTSDDGRTRSPEERGWKHFPFSEVFESKPDPWCIGLPLNGHGVGMSGCGAKGQAKIGKKAEEILEYYYPGTEITKLR